MSRDPGLRFRKFLCFAQFCIKFWEKLPNLGTLAQEQESYRQKTNWVVENTPPPSSGYRIKREANNIACDFQ